MDNYHWAILRRWSKHVKRIMTFCFGIMTCCFGIIFCLLRSHGVLLRDHDFLLRNHDCLLWNHDCLLWNHDCSLWNHDCWLWNHDFLLRNHDFSTAENICPAQGLNKYFNTRLGLPYKLIYLFTYLLRRNPQVFIFTIYFYPQHIVVGLLNSHPWVSSSLLHLSFSDPPVPAGLVLLLLLLFFDPSHQN